MGAFLVVVIGDTFARRCVVALTVTLSALLCGSRGGGGIVGAAGVRTGAGSTVSARIGARISSRRCRVGSACRRCYSGCIGIFSDDLAIVANNITAFVDGADVVALDVRDSAIVKFHHLGAAVGFNDFCLRAFVQINTGQEGLTFVGDDTTFGECSKDVPLRIINRSIFGDIKVFIGSDVNNMDIFGHSGKSAHGHSSAVSTIPSQQKGSCQQQGFKERKFHVTSLIPITRSKNIIMWPNWLVKKNFGVTVVIKIGCFGAGFCLHFCVFGQK